MRGRRQRRGAAQHDAPDAAQDDNGRVEDGTDGHGADERGPGYPQSTGPEPDRHQSVQEEENDGNFAESRLADR